MIQSLSSHDLCINHNSSSTILLPSLTITQTKLIRFPIKGDHINRRIAPLSIHHSSTYIVTLIRHILISPNNHPLHTSFSFLYTGNSFSIFSASCSIITKSTPDSIGANFLRLLLVRLLMVPLGAPVHGKGFSF